MLVREETYRNGSTIGIVAHAGTRRGRARTRHLLRRRRPRAGLRRVHQGRQALRAALRPARRCSRPMPTTRTGAATSAARPRWCSTTARARLKAQRLVHERGERRKSEILGDDGTVREQRETTTAAASSARSTRTARSGAKCNGSSIGGERNRRVDDARAGVPRERQAGPREALEAPASAAASSVSEQHWYLNGQPRDRTEYADVDGQALRTETALPRQRQEGLGRQRGADRRPARGDRSRPACTGAGTATACCAARASTTSAAGSRASAQIDASGTVVRDDEVFEDGSRKALGK